MPSRRSIIRTILLPGFVLIVLKLFSSASAQQPEPVQFPVMSAERVAQFLEAADRKLDYLPGEVLVKFKDGVQPAGQQRALQALRSRPDAGQLEWIGDVALLRDASQPNARILAEQLSSQPEVAYAEPNYLRHVHTVPNDPGYSRQWNFGAIGLPTSWDISPGGTSEVIVAVVDTGVTAVTPQTMAVRTWNGSAIVNFSPQVGPSPDITFGRLVSARDFTVSSTNPSSFVVDTDGHGTHVASTIGEDTNNSVAEAGIAYNARIMPVKVCTSSWDVQFAFSAAGGRGFVSPDSGGCPTAAVAQGIRYAADNGAKVINLSLGGSSPSTTEQDAIVYAVGKGAFVAIAAGNEKEDGNPTHYPAFYAASIEGAMAVAATNRSGNRAYYSNTGSYVEIAAPGGDSRDSDASGIGFIWQSTIRPSLSDPSAVLFPRFDSYTEVGYSGTSMATPHVAGLAALLSTQGVTKPAAIEQLIKKTAKFLGTPSAANASRNDEFGFGLIQPRAALFGFGIRK